MINIYSFVPVRRIEAGKVTLDQVKKEGKKKISTSL